MVLDESVSGRTLADESKVVNTAILHKRGHDLATRAAQDVDGAWREVLLEQTERREVRRSSIARNTQDDGVSDDQSGNECRITFVERIVERA